MLAILTNGIRDIYDWSIRKLRSAAFDIIALFNKEYADSKRIGYVMKDLEIKCEIEPLELNTFEIKHNLVVDWLKELEQWQKFVKNLGNVIRFRIEALVGLSFIYHYNGRDPAFYALSKADKINSIIKGNTDLVLLLWLMYVHVPIGDHGTLLEDFTMNP